MAELAVRRSFILLNLLFAFFLNGCASAGQPVHIATPAGKIEAPQTATPQATLKPGSLVYIVDLGDRVGDRLTQISAVDPDSLQVAFSFETRYGPVAALSPDGLRLFVSDTYFERTTRGASHDVLSIYDALSGQLVIDDHPVPGRAIPIGAPPDNMFLFFPVEGDRLYLLDYGKGSDQGNMRVARLDPKSLEKQEEFDWPPACGRLIRAEDSAWLCSRGGELTRIDPQNEAAWEVIASFNEAVAGTAITSDGKRLYLVLQNQTGPQAQVVQLDLPTGRIVSKTTLTAPPGWILLGRNLAIAQNGDLIYLGAEQENERNGYALEVWGFKTAGGEQAAAFNVSGRIDDFATNSDGSQLYIASGETASLTIIDSASQEIIKTLKGVGRYPAKILVPLR
jgi:DNA-binding beta-propeller fold protein YncE